jgi:hypothetical protein
MIWNDELLFLHPQKTAGLAISAVLWDILRTPVFNSVPLDHWDPILRPGVAQVLGLRHENLFEAQSILVPFGRNLADFQSILVVMRNPYDMEISRYYHLRKPDALETSEDRHLAQTLSFDEYVRTSRFRLPHPDDPDLEFREDIRYFYTLGPEFPKNIRILRYEHLEADLNEVLNQFGYSEVTIPKVNVSHERPALSFHQVIQSRHVEEAIFMKYRWMFEHGFYPRLDMRTNHFAGGNNKAEPLGLYSE